MYFVPLLILRKCLISLIEIYCFIDFYLIILMVKYLRPIKSLYKDTVSTVKINDYITEYFDVLHGVKQGDNLSPTLFNLFINNLASQIKELHCGIKIGIEQVSILLYADDIVLLSDSEKGLQSMLTYLNTWCMQWCFDIIVLKSNIIHFRPISICM